MPQTINQRMTVHIEGDFVVFLIGMRINRFWKFHKWMPVALAMPKMLKELSQKPESGFLGAQTSLGVIVQYWRSFEQLEAYATSADFKPMTEGVELHVEFEADGDKTNFTFSVIHATEEYCKQQEKMGFYNGWGSAFNRMESVIINQLKK
jgi:hypothetical protein